MSAVGGCLIVATIVLSWPPRTLSILLQLLGILMTAFGVDVVRSLLELASDKAVDKKHGLERWFGSSV